MGVYHNEPDKLIHDPEYFLNYRWWILSEHEINKI